MIDSFEKDLPFLKRKYHEEEYNAYAAWLSHGDEYDKSTGLEDVEIRKGLETLINNHCKKPHSVIKAMSIKYILENTMVDVNEHDWFIGIWSWNKVLREVLLNRWQNEIFDRSLPQTRAIMNTYTECGAVAMWVDYDHSVPDFDALFEYGFPGILERAKQYRNIYEANGLLTPKETAYFDSIELVYSAILAFLRRVSEYAETKTHQKAPAIATCLNHLQTNAPKNTFEVLQMIYIYFIICEYIGCLQVRSIGGNLDRVLYPYFKRDIENGTYTKEQIGAFLKYFFLQFSAIGNYWNHPLYLAGTDENGESTVNELSYLILDVYDELGIFNPKLQIKLAPNTPEAFQNKALDMIRRKNASIVFVCEPAVKRALMGIGYTEEEARTCDVKGCYETAARAKEVSTAPLYINMLKPIEFVFYNGMDKKSGKQIGVKTGECENFTSFDQFYEAYLIQLKSVLIPTMQAVDSFEAYLDDINPTPIFSATILSSLEKAQDAYSTGSKYNTTGVLCAGGAANAVDSLMVLKHFVFDTKEYSINDFKVAIDHDWNGYEVLRQKAKNYIEKYGNNHVLADRYMEAITRYFGNMILLRPNARGGFYKPIMHSARMFLNFAPFTHATPDGRKRGDELSKNSSPANGMDSSGATALILSATKLDTSLYPESFCLDVMLHPSAVSGKDGLTAMRGLLSTYMSRYGTSIQFNVFDATVLKDAQQNPDRYQNLQVRVCGWNVYFNEMNKTEQDAYIIRADQIGRC